MSEWLEQHALTALAAAAPYLSATFRQPADLARLKAVERARQAARARCVPPPLLNPGQVDPLITP